MHTVHADRAALPSVTRTEEGYLRGVAVVTRIGVFTYENGDGTYRRELRHPDDVLASDSLASLAMIPITVDHPSVMVNADNASTLSVGQTGENARVDGRHIAVPLTITGKAGLDAVSRGKQELSLGYKLDLVEEVGVYDGESYTHRQRNIRYNHLAIVDQARAGKAARLNLDGIDAAVLNVDTTENTMQKVNVDGITYDAAPEVANALAKAQNSLASTTADLATTKARADKAEAERDQAKADLATATEKLKNTVNTDKLPELVEARVALTGKVARVVALDAADAKLSDRHLMEKALKARHSDINLDGKSDEYVLARFDAMIDSLGTVDDKTQRIAPSVTNPTTGRTDAQIAAAAWQKGVDAMNDWRNPKAS